MATNLIRDASKLLPDGNKIGVEIENLERNWNNLAIEEGDEDLRDLIETIKKMETPASPMLVNSVSADFRKGEKERDFAYELPRILARLDALFDDETSPELKEDGVFQKNL